MFQFKRLLLGLALGMLLLTSCLDSGGQSPPDSATEEAGIVSGLPSISELAGTPAPEIPPLPILEPDEIALGREVYETHCADCHGENLEGEPNWQVQNEDKSFRAPPHDANGHTWHHGDKVLIETIELGGSRLPDNIGGSSKMPAFAEILSDEEITAILTYIKSTWPDDIRAIQWEQTNREP
jgi:mono/diheme cytochrome c family protein